MIHYVSVVIHDMMKAAVRCWLGGKIVGEKKAWSQTVVFFVYERDLQWWPGDLEGKRVRVTMTLEDLP